ncbi:hypothetical protein BURK1_03210 [Burkholderiales bacterium]|nr:hypothetical protein BURK1_03210 [Burkholderiales bacterium]
MDRHDRQSAAASAAGARSAHPLGTWAVAIVAALAAPLAACAHSPAPVVSSHLATVEILDRTSGTWLPVYQSGGERWIVGTPGHEYTIRIRNRTGARLLAVPSVDGINAISGETASPDQSGYVLEPYGSVDISGWRKSLSHTAAFYFTDVADSYAGRTGRPLDVGVIGVAVFRERVPVAYAPHPKIAAQRAERGDMPASAAAPAPSAEAQSAGILGMDRDASEVAGAEGARKRALDSRLGTGHGRNETSHAQRVGFERATASPEAVVAIRYDRLETLVSRGIVPGPRYAGRTPSAFPAWPGFAPDPR